MSEGVPKATDTNERQPNAPQDLADFNVRWGEFRDTAVGVACLPTLSVRQQEVVAWLVKLADRVGPRDLQ